MGTDDEWRGWWGPNPPFHTPVFVLTHHERPSIEMEGGTVFHFVDASPQEALDLAREAAGDLDVRIGGGPTVVRDFLVADLIDILHVVQVPILLGRGTRLWDGLEGVEERYEIEAALVTERRHPEDLTFTHRMTDPADELPPSAGLGSPLLQVITLFIRGAGSSNVSTYGR